MRNSSPNGWGQGTVDSADQLVRNLNDVKGEAPGYVSVYSFPEGHTSENGENVPLIDTLMFDLDFEGSKDASDTEWRKDMTALLVRTRMVAQALLDSNRAQYWRASLSGHKGIHLYLDFPALDRREGTAGQFRNGLRKYTDDLLETIQSETGLNSLDEYVDVMSGKDFARLTRLPNTVHDKATARFGETRFCVPVTIEELSQITVDEYVELTSRPRPLPSGCKRIESQFVHDVLVQEIRRATDKGVLVGSHSSAMRDESRIETTRTRGRQNVLITSQMNQSMTGRRGKLMNEERNLKQQTRRFYTR